MSFSAKKKLKKDEEPTDEEQKNETPADEEQKKESTADEEQTSEEGEGEGSSEEPTPSDPPAEENAALSEPESTSQRFEGYQNYTVVPDFCDVDYPPPQTEYNEDLPWTEKFARDIFGPYY